MEQIIINISKTESGDTTMVINVGYDDKSVQM